MNAEAAFNALNQREQNRMRHKFDWWMQGNNGPVQWFHGFDDQARELCFVFKRKKGHTHYRYYGFLIDPQPRTDPGYRVCVLTNHGQKNTEATDPAETNFANALRINFDVIAAVKTSFPEQ